MSFTDLLCKENVLGKVIVSALDVGPLYYFGCASRTCSALRLLAMQYLDWCIYAINGERDGGASVHCYSVRDDAWRTLPCVPNVRLPENTATEDIATACVLDGDVYFLGIGGADRQSPFLLRYDAWNQKWDSLDAPILWDEIDMGRHVIVHQGAIYMVGSHRTPHTVARYAPGGPWELLPVLPEERKTRLASCKGTLYSLGCIAEHGAGDPASDLSGSFERFDSTSERWHTLPALEHPLLIETVCCGELWPIGAQLVCVLLGNEDEWHDDGLGMCWTCDLATSQWSRRQNMLTPRRVTTSCAFRGALYVFGGCEEDDNGSAAVEFYVPSSGAAMHECESDGSAISRVTGRVERNRWRPAPDILHEAAQSYLVPADQSCVFSVGGCFDDRAPPDYTALDCYIPESSGSSFWAPLATMPRRHMCGVAVIVPRPGHHRFLCE